MADEFDMDSAVAGVADQIFDSPSEDVNDDNEDIDVEAAPVVEDEVAQPAAEDELAAPAVEDETAQPVVEARPAPQSWAKDKHEVWSKMPVEAQDYYIQREQQMLAGLEQYKEHSTFGKQLRDVFTPYKALLQAQGVDEAKATQYMLNAHYRLSSGSPQDKAAYFATLADSYKIDMGLLPQPGGQTQVDPTVRALQEKVGSLEQSLTQRQQAEMTAAQQKVAADVQAFASDPKHPYFDECSDDIVAFVQAGSTLEAAYEKAVYANPVTRAKEIARLQAENEAALREKAGKSAQIAKKASSTNVRSRDTQKAPTEPKGTMRDTMLEALEEIKTRVH